MNQKSESLGSVKTQSRLVAENKRLTFMPKYFGNHRFLQAESAIYNVLWKLCTTHKCAYWNYYELDNGGFYLAPSFEEKLELIVESNGYQGCLSADAAGIVITLLVINQLCWLDQSEVMINQYYSLREFAAEHNEAGEIFSAID